MNCSQSELWIQRALDESLSARERAALDTHLGVCAECAARWREYRQLARAATRWVQEPPLVSEDFTMRLMARVETRAAASRPPVPTLWPSLGAAAAFALAGIWLVQTRFPAARISTAGLTPDTQALQSVPAWFASAPGVVHAWLTSAPADISAWFASAPRDLSGDAASLLRGASIPGTAFIVPLFLITLAANALLIHRARRQTV